MLCNAVNHRRNGRECRCKYIGRTMLPPSEHCRIIRTPELHVQQKFYILKQKRELRREEILIHEGTFVRGVLKTTWLLHKHKQIKDELD